MDVENANQNNGINELFNVTQNINEKNSARHGSVEKIY